MDDENYYTFIDNISNIKEIIKDFYLENEEYERIINYDVNKWLSHLKYTFKNIWEQYIKDSRRCIIKINGDLFTNYDKIKDYINGYSILKQNYILIILTQSIFAFPFILLHNNVKINNTNLIVSEISNLDIKTFGLNKNIVYECIFKKNIINIKINKYLRIFDFSDNSDKTVCIINLHMEFNLYNFNYSIIKINFTPI